MLNITKQDVDDACAGYARATQEYPRREGIRCALLAARQLSDSDRDFLLRICLTRLVPDEEKRLLQIVGLRGRDE